MSNKWISFVKEFRSENPELSYKQALKDAKAPYRASKGGSSVGGSLNPITEIKKKRGRKPKKALEKLEEKIEEKVEEVVKKKRGRKPKSVTIDDGAVLIMPKKMSKKKQLKMKK